MGSIEEEVEYTSVAGPLLPLVIGQGPHFDRDDNATHWLLKKQRAPMYLDLLYDIGISSVLSLFTDSHEILDGASIVAYFSYFIIIWWVWESQINYDCRFQANDWIHRLFKFLQLGSFGYIGVFAKGFDPRFIVSPSDITTSWAVAQVVGGDSFQGVALAYAASRILLMTQYIYVVTVTRKEDLKGRWPCLLLPLGSCLISGSFWFIAGLSTGSAGIKLGLGYTGLGLELIAHALTWHLENPIEPPTSLMSERFADLTVIILAEGVMGILTTLGDVVAGWGLNAGGSAWNGYSECFSSLVIIYATWHFLFHAFNPEARFTSHRVGIVWAVLHIPLHFVMLLLLSGMRNVAVFGNISDAVREFDTVFNQTVYIGPEDVGIEEMWPRNADLVLEMNKLSLTPPFLEEVNAITNQVEIIARDGDPAFDPRISLLQYCGQVWMEVAESYGVELTNKTQDFYNALANASTTWVRDSDDLYYNATLQSEDFELLYLADLIRSSLFFLPSSGGLIVISAALTIFRTTSSSAPSDSKYHDDEAHEGLLEDGKSEASGIPVYMNITAGKSSSDIWSWIPLGVHFAIGVGLCLLGFLDIGPSLFNTPEASLLTSGWAMPLVAIIYAALIILDFALLAIHRVMRGGGWKTPHISSTKAGSSVHEYMSVDQATSLLPTAPLAYRRLHSAAPSVSSNDVPDDGAPYSPSKVLVSGRSSPTESVSSSTTVAPIPKQGEGPSTGFDVYRKATFKREEMDQH